MYDIYQFFFILDCAVIVFQKIITTKLKIVSINFLEDNTF